MEYATYKADTHFHVVPDTFRKVLVSQGLRDIPDWSLEATGQFMKDFSISPGIMSISTPGPGILGTGRKARSLARKLNQEMGSYVRNSSLAPDLGFFGTLPDWRDVEGTLAELDFLFQKQKSCSGVTALSSYGDMLLGNPMYQPIWARLQKYKALVFIHPTGLDVLPSRIAPGLPQFVVDFLWSTTRTAVELVTTGTMSAAPDVDVILAHAGGTLPFSGPRALQTLKLPGAAEVSAVTSDEARVQFGRFYYDVAISASPSQLNALLDFAGPEHVLYGSDFPYLPVGAIGDQTEILNEFQSAAPRGPELANEVLRNNTLTLLNKHSPGRVFD